MGRPVIKRCSGGWLRLDYRWSGHNIPTTSSAHRGRQNCLQLLPIAPPLLRSALASNKRFRDAIRLVKIRRKSRTIANASIEHGRMDIGACDSTTVLRITPARRFDPKNHCAVRVVQPG
jgi:hypothetical protein